MPSLCALVRKGHRAEMETPEARAAFTGGSEGKGTESGTDNQRKARKTSNTSVGLYWGVEVE